MRPVWLTQTTLVTCVTFYWCHLLFAIRVITLLSYSLGHLMSSFFSSRKSELYTHTHTHTLSHTHTYADTHTLVHRQVPGCAFDAPPAKWSCCFLAPVTVETADCITSAHQRGTARWKRETISPSFHLLTSVMAAPPFSFVLCTPPLVPFTPPFMSPSPPSPFIKNPQKWKGKKSDRSTVSNLAENVTHASEHKILPRPSHWPQSKSEEAYLNTASMMVSCSESWRKFAPFLPSNKSIVLSVTVCSPLMENSPCTRIDIMFLLWSFWVNECSWTRARLPESIEPRLV